MKKRWQPLKYPLVIYIFLILSLCLNLYFLVSPSFKSEGEVAAGWQQLKAIMEPGTYGPSDLETVEGPLRISAPGVKLQNTRVKGDLILTAAIGEGCADLVRVCVEETVLVQGGGEDTVVIEDTVIKNLVIAKEKGKVRVVLKGSSIVDKITIQGEASLSAVGLSGEDPVKEISIETDAGVELEGYFDGVTVAEKEAQVTLLAGEIKKLSISEGASDALLAVNEEAVVGILETEASLEVSGGGLVKEAVVTGPGLFKFYGNAEKVSAGGKGIFLEFGPGNTDTLLVEASEGTVMVHLTSGAVIKYAEMNGAAGVTGSGDIERIRINVSGVTMERSPGSLELAKGVKANVAGEERTKEPEKTQPESSNSTSSSTSTPKPSTPTVSINAIANQVLDPFKKVTVPLTVSPGSADINVSSSNTGVAKVTCSGNALNIEVYDTQGTATITVSGSKSGYKGCTRTFKVTMDPISDFKIGDKLPMITVVAVKLKYPNAQDYKVTIGKTSLDFLGGSDFGGSVPADDANRGNVRVVRK